MAERSFAREVQDLRLGAGEMFRGEGILAITKALLQSGCPSLSVKPTNDPLRDDPVAAIDQSCVGCGNCGEVADAAVLCPSFYRADIISNPTRLDRALARLRGAVISFLQRRRDGRRLAFPA